MSNKVWVCFNCRTTTRRSGYSRDVRCQSCSQPCECLGYKIAVPPKNQIKQWEVLRDHFYQVRREYLLKRKKEHTEAVHSFEKEIVRLEALPENPGRTAAIKQLKKRLADCEKFFNN